MEYLIDRKVWQPLWTYYMEDLGSNFRDCIGDTFIQYNNATFEVQAYNWDDIDGEIQEYNFWHKPSGYKIKWYKYAMRGAEHNMDLSPDMFIDILQDCRNSINDDRNISIHIHVDRWWENE